MWARRKADQPRRCPSFLPEGGSPSCGENAAAALLRAGTDRHSADGQACRGRPGCPEARLAQGPTFSPVVQLWPPSDLGVKLQSIPKALITFVFLCGHELLPTKDNILKYELLEFLTRTQRNLLESYSLKLSQLVATWERYGVGSLCVSLFIPC